MPFKLLMVGQEWLQQVTILNTYVLETHVDYEVPQVTYREWAQY
jgi:hypothetical protein